MDKATLATAVGLPILTLLSGWALAAWRGARHRTWEALSKDLELADKLSTVGLAGHALWLRQSVAIRLKGRAMADSRQRSDLLTGLYGCFFFVIGIATFRFVGIMSHEGDTFGVVIGAFIVIINLVGGGMVAHTGFKKGYRIPGMSDWFLKGNQEAVQSLRSQLELLHTAAGELPDAIPKPQQGHA
ncbi:hypothetical protein ONA92_21740 [Mycobacteroides salmoniphilum]|uniref:hypothetical protein n=1 Tax=Mycobacteroides salmoniphilum TaxID=404941 RepID=UPI003567E594